MTEGSHLFLWLQVSGESNSLAERAVRSLKDVLKKSSGRITDLHISEIVFAINAHVSAEGTGSNYDHFLGRSVQSGLPNNVKPKLDTEEFIHK